MFKKINLFFVFVLRYVLCTVCTVRVLHGFPFSHSIALYQIRIFSALSSKIIWIFPQIQCPLQLLRIQLVMSLVPDLCSEKPDIYCTAYSSTSSAPALMSSNFIWTSRIIFGTVWCSIYQPKRINFRSSSFLVIVRRKKRWIQNKITCLLSLWL